jgi:hypothetical protein
MAQYLKKEEDFRSSLLKAAEGKGKGAAAAVQATRVLQRWNRGELGDALHNQLLDDASGESGTSQPPYKSKQALNRQSPLCGLSNHHP